MRFKALNTLAVVYQIIAVTVAVVGTLGGIVVAAAPNYTIDPVSYKITDLPRNPLPGIGVVFVALFLALSIYAFGQLIQLLVALEDNTRETADYLSRMRGGSKTQTQTAPQLAKRRVLDDVPEPDM